MSTTLHLSVTILLLALTTMVQLRHNVMFGCILDTSLKSVWGVAITDICYAILMQGTDRT